MDNPEAKSGLESGENEGSKRAFELAQPEIVGPRPRSFGEEFMAEEDEPTWQGVKRIYTAATRPIKRRFATERPKPAAREFKTEIKAISSNLVEGEEIVKPNPEIAEPQQPDLYNLMYEAAQIRYPMPEGSEKFRKQYEKAWAQTAKNELFKVQGLKDKEARDSLLKEAKEMIEARVARDKVYSEQDSLVVKTEQENQDAWDARVDRAKDERKWRSQIKPTGKLELWLYDHFTGQRDRKLEEQGKKPSTVGMDNSAKTYLEELNDKIGLRSVVAEVTGLVDSLRANHKNRLRAKKLEPEAIAAYEKNYSLAAHEVARILELDDYKRLREVVLNNPQDTGFSDDETQLLRDALAYVDEENRKRKSA